MNDLFAVYPFDGWHIDTFGEQGAYALKGTLVHYISSMSAFIEHADSAMGKRVVMNAVNTRDQAAVTNTSADFVFSELRDNPEAFASLEKSADEVSRAKPQKSYVIAAHVNRNAK